VTLCPICYEPCDRGDYASRGLRLLSPRLDTLHPFAFARQEALQLAVEQKVKMSISGLQPKLGAQLSLKNRCFELTPKGGAFILKPDNPHFQQVPANEAATMHIAGLAGLEKPLSGMVYDRNQELIYFVKRFDRVGKGKLAVEDFGQLLGLPRVKKYDAGIEDLVRVVQKYTSFPALELPRLYRLLLLNFLLGNEDGHVKNFSLITDAKGVARLSPVYDLVNTTILSSEHSPAMEETALPLRGRKKGLTRQDFEDYLGLGVMNLPARIIRDIGRNLEQALVRAAQFIHSESFLPAEMKLRYLFTLGIRRLRLGMHAPLPDGEFVGYLYLEEKGGLAFARLEMRGMNLAFTRIKGMEKFQDKLVKIKVASGEARIGLHPV
jgi:serine/threonine-protein kinase HipA